MKHLKPGKEFDDMAQRLLNPDMKYVLWGAANIGREIYEVYSGEIQITRIVDKDGKKQGERIGRLVIENPEQLELTNDYIVLITTSALDAVHEELEKKGFRKNEHYMDYMFFVKLYELYKRNRLVSERIDISLTEKCTLKCKKCNMFMPYFKNPQEQSFEKVKEDIDAYFDVVDFVFGFNLLGGEPYLYSELEHVVEYVGENYRDRIRKFELFTNATLLPSAGLLEKFKKYHVINQISDYTNRVDYSKRIQEFADLLEKHNLPYYTMQSDTWGDFGFPENPNTLIHEEQLISFFNTCRAPFRGLYEKKVYFCHLETSAIRAGLYSDHENDYFLLTANYEDRKKAFLEFDQGFTPNGYITFCAKCRGCDCVNDLTVPSAEQF